MFASYRRWRFQITSPDEIGVEECELDADLGASDDWTMYHYDPETALEELNEDAVLPHPVHVRDMIVRAGLSPEKALELNRKFQDYLHAFGELQKVVRPLLEELAQVKR